MRGPAARVVVVVLAALLLSFGCARPTVPPATPPPAGGTSGGTAGGAAGGAPGGTAAEPVPAPELPSASRAMPPEVQVEPGAVVRGEGAADPWDDPWDGPILLRIGLASDLPRVELPCCAPGQRLEGDGRSLPVADPLSGPLTVEPDPGSAAVLRLQVAALRDEEQARVLARQLAQRWGWPSDAHFDAGVGLYRVRTGRFPDRATAEAARGRLAAAGTSGAWIVSEGDLVRPALRVVVGGRATAVPGRWLRLSAEGRDGGLGQAWDGKRYRGDLLVFLNARGALNVVNEVPLEDYLRGVVPAEMGPELYPRLQALKAQAVAARTYTLRHLGGFRDEGYDLCATPRCQVYGGQGAEHPLSDQAVAETAGQVLMHDGELVDARYSATCGGHTEDVALVFPQEADGRVDAYLRGVPCIEAGATVLEGAALEGAPFPQALLRHLLPPAGPAGAGRGSAAELDSRLRALAVRAGLAASPASPPAAPGSSALLASTRREEVRRRVSVLFDLALGPRVLMAGDDLPRRAAAPPADWSREEVRQASLLAASGLFDGPPDRELTAAEEERLLLHLARVAGVLRSEELDFHAIDRSGPERRLRVRRFGDAADRFLALPPDLQTFRRRGDALLASDLALVPGDPVEVWFARSGATGGGATSGAAAAGDELPVAVIHDADPARVVANPPHQRSRWQRFKSDAELARQVEQRYPGLGFRGFQVLRRGVSGRVGAIRLEGSGGRTVDVEGLAVRWTLDVPDTRFRVRRSGNGYRFEGTGWGHGVGLCQAGSFALAGREVPYDHILRHYYTGVHLARVRARAPLWSEPAPVTAGR